MGTVANSCSTMHKIHAQEFTLEDFSTEHLCKSNIEVLEELVLELEYWRDKFVNYDEYCKVVPEFRETYSKKDCWWQMIQLLPSSYNQRRTVMLNYEVLANIYKSRRNHKLDEWHVFCEWIENLPYSEFITGGEVESEFA